MRQFDEQLLHVDPLKNVDIRQFEMQVRLYKTYPEAHAVQPEVEQLLQLVVQ